jgi:ubiquitin-like 1-activating enzyme E1 B
MDPLKVLVVGAGGIGCELLKILVLSNFKNITVVDLDTIDKSNLNRQLLFKREDIGKSKAEVVAKVITGLRPEISIVGIQANVNTFKDSFFKEFRVVFNALDNLEARRYVNRMCCFLNIPLIDAGTKSTAGQVTVHIPGVSACYDCEPKSSAKQYPVCTIRSTPTKPEHCIAWSKYLYEALFGPEDASNMLSDIFLRPETTISELFAQLFSRDLPENATALEYEPCLNPSPIKETGIPNIEELVSGLTYSFEKLISREKLAFSKNDKLAVQFIASTSNLRSLNFGLPLTEIMKIEEIAGNIIPAIASTNAIVAGLQVIEAIKLINNLETYGTVWVTAEPSNNKYIIPEKISTPKENV